MIVYMVTLSARPYATQSDRTNHSSKANLYALYPNVQALAVEICRMSRFSRSRRVSSAAEKCDLATVNIGEGTGFINDLQIDKLGSTQCTHRNRDLIWDKVYVMLNYGGSKGGDKYRE